MNLTRKLFFKSNNFFLKFANHLLFLMYLGIFFAALPQAPGDDINAARVSFRALDGNDFLGAFNVFYYGASYSIFGQKWYLFLHLLQLSLAYFGLALVLKKILNPSLLQLGAFFLFSYVSMFFSVATSRDGSMLSFLTIGFAFIYLCIKDFKLIYLIIATFFLTIGYAFRPWLSFSILFIFFSLKQIFLINFFHKKLIIFSFAIGMVFAPILLDQTVKKVFSIPNGYPEQQVVMFDLASIYCWSNNPRSTKIALSGLNVFSQSNNISNYICQYLSPDAGNSLFVSRTPQTIGIGPPLHWLSSGNDYQFKIARLAWLNIIVNEPLSFVKLKLLRIPPVLWGGESWQIQMRSYSSFPDIVNQIFTKLVFLIQTPFFALKALHIFSPIFLLLFFFSLFLRKINILASNSKSFLKNSISGIFGSSMWFFLSIISYVADNGRYTYGMTLIFGWSYFFILARKN